MACFSFYANEIITSGEGGIVMTDDDALAERLRLLRDASAGTPRFVHDEAASTSA
jgi:perosamine synthetase